MKQLIHKLGDREILCIEFPKDATEFEYFRYSSISDEIGYKLEGYYRFKVLPPGNWQLICEYPGATEEQAAKVVFSKWSYDIAERVYKNYNSKNREWLGTALEALQSLVKSLGIETQTGIKIPSKTEVIEKYPDPIKRLDYIIELTDKYLAAQSKVWEKILILTNNK